MKKIAEKHGKSVAQAVIRWDLQRGIVTIPKSTHREWIITNTNLYDFKLSADDRKVINALDQNPQRSRIGQDPNSVDF